MSGTRPDISRVSSVPTRVVAGAALVGFALGGFFDGILLHQVLQWHHLFSLVPGDTWRDMRMQIMMDGWFHVLHFVIAVIGLSLLWTAGKSSRPADRGLLAAAILGFSAWQFIDVVVFHWMLVIHRIRVDVPHPLAYDLGWLVAFAVTSLVAGLWLWRNQSEGGGGSRWATAALSVVPLLAGPFASVPPRDAAATVVMFRDAQVAADAIATIDARIVWSSPDGDAVALVPPTGTGRVSGAWRLYGRGALLVSDSPVLGGCLTWSRT